MNNESPVAAVRRVLREQFGVDDASNIGTMMMIDAVRNATPPSSDVTIGMLKKILQSMSPSHAIDMWAIRSSRDIVSRLAKHPAVSRAAELIDNEHLWCEIEGTISAMLWRVSQGMDLDTPIEGPIAHRDLARKFQTGHVDIKDGDFIQLATGLATRVHVHQDGILHYRNDDDLSVEYHPDAPPDGIERLYTRDEVLAILNESNTQ